MANLNNLYKLNKPEYWSWYSMNRRCHKQPKKDYGLNGITVCDEWRYSFANFLKDMGPRPSEKYSIDRIDNNKGYYKENCRWATAIEQGRNKKVNVNLTYQGKTMCIAAWSLETGLSHGLIRNRLLKGWSIDKVLSRQKFSAVAKPKIRVIKRRNSKTQYRGVYLRPVGKRFSAQIRAKGKTFYLGTYHSDIEAAKIYNLNAIKHFGEKAVLNPL